MDSVPYFGLARWLFCLEDMVPVGVAGLLSRPCLGTAECTVLEKLITQTSNWECLSTPIHLWLEAKAKASVSGLEICVNLGVEEKSLFFLQGLIGHLNPYWNSQSLLCNCIQPRQLLALEGSVSISLEPPIVRGLKSRHKNLYQAGTWHTRLLPGSKVCVWDWQNICLAIFEGAWEQMQGRYRALCWLEGKANLTERVSAGCIAVLMSLASDCPTARSSHIRLIRRKKKWKKRKPT